MRKRTAKDEYQFDEHLRQAEQVKTEVIADLKRERDVLLHNQMALLKQVIATTELLRDALDTLTDQRKAILKETQAAIDRGADCANGCAKHEWDSVEGWVRR